MPIRRFMLHRIFLIGSRIPEAIDRVAGSDRAIGSLDILGREERETILQGWNDTAHPVSAATLPELFAAQVARPRMRLRWCSRRRP